MRATGVLADDGRMLVSFGSIGLSNAQQKVIAGLGLLLALLYRWWMPSRAFTLVGVIAASWLWMTVGVRQLDGLPPSRETVGELLRWMLCPCTGLMVGGLLLDRRTSRPSADLVSVAPPRDGSPALAVALVLTVFVLAGMSYVVPEWLWCLPLDRDAAGRVTAEPTVTQRAGGFLGSGMLLLCLSLGLEVHSTSLRDRCARSLRWLIPSFILLPIAWLEFETAPPGWGFWMAMLGAAAVTLILSSAVLQWRPFLLSGLLAFIDIFVRCFVRIEQLPGEGRGAKLALTVGVAVLGVLVMLAASYPERTMRALIQLRRRMRDLSAID
jgi:hypothetical protein